jgi:hypothetical protein
MFAALMIGHHFSISAFCSAHRIARLLLRIVAGAGPAATS